MKRIISILFSVLTVLVTVHPAMAFHFCSGSLASVEFFKSQETNPCCCSGAEASQQNVSESFVQTECCHTSVVELSVDDFEYTGIERSAQPVQPIVCHYAMLNTSDVSDDCFATDIISYAPPEHFFITGREILTRICTLII